ncbi:hypothetical protein N7470_001519 [Penicillium chermesinum]|nr:hypothetical protein N7470_001519 [Penicillium chermesinum]
MDRLTLLSGLRSNKGNEEEFIQASLRECKIEIKTQDMDKKATALLKLVYLEMFGYDMSWASFNVLEVMSSQKYPQKRVGYLGAVQSFRPDTEVLMLATNMLKKDIVSPNIPNLSLPLAALPHILTPSLAMSLLPDILSRLSHSSPAVRKKTIVCLYRIALVYPDALKLAWPKIKEHLLDDQEDTSVTSAAINVVCELGWRRPHDFLPLAPRFFELLVDSGNNWMAIKIIKLFATLTPLEPRLTRKLLRPLTNIIQTTSAMSLLYECINGIIQGGILDGDDSLQERDEVATLCVSKLRGMIYVALLALNRIVASHPMLVAMQQDVIMDCLDDPDISIRLQALDLAAGMVTSDILQEVVNRLIDQLRLASSQDASKTEALAHPDDEEPEVKGSDSNLPSINLPNDYRTEVAHRILDMCAQNNYSEIADFEWYVGVLIQLVRLLPPSSTEDAWLEPGVGGPDPWNITKDTPAFRIGSEIRNIAVRVKGVRAEATQAAEALLRSPSRTLQSLIDSSNISLPAGTLQLFLQAIPKVFIQVNRGFETKESWKSEMTLLLARVVEFLEGLADHPDLDVQERAIEFLEILRLGAESLNSETEQVPFLLQSVIPSLFTGLELNPVAITAQKKVVLPPELRLDEPFNEDLPGLFQNLDNSPHDASQHHVLQNFYYLPDYTPVSQKSAIEFTPAEVQLESSYQGSDYLAPSDRRRERKERYRDDPFYIAPLEPTSGVSTPNNEGLDLDAIPIVDLKLDDAPQPAIRSAPKPRRGASRRMEVAGDETFGNEEAPLPSNAPGSAANKRSLLQIDSSNLGQFSLQEDDPIIAAEEDADMRKAMQNVEKMRLRMQRTSERIELEGIPAEGTLVKKKKKKTKTQDPDQPGAEKKKKKKKKEVN